MSVERLENLRAEAHCAGERYQLYKRRPYGPRPTKSARTRDLQRIYEYAEARLCRRSRGAWRVPKTSDGEPGEIFPEEVVRQILTDQPDAEYHALQIGHFALEDRAAEIAALMRALLARTVPAHNGLSGPSRPRAGGQGQR